MARRKSLAKLITIENALKRLLVKFYNANIKDSLSPTEELRQQYESKVKNLIRKTVQDAYEHGTEQVADVIGNDFNLFLSQTDISNIVSLTNKANDQFWKTATRLHRRESEFILLPNADELIQKIPFDTTAALIGFSAFATFLSFNEATTDKLDQLGGGQLEFVTARDFKVDPEICEPLDGQIFNTTDPDIPQLPLHNHCRCTLIPVEFTGPVGEELF